MSTLKESLGCIDLNKIPKDNKAYEFVQRCQNLTYEPSEKQNNFIAVIKKKKEWYKDTTPKVSSESSSEPMITIPVRVLENLLCQR